MSGLVLLLLAIPGPAQMQSTKVETIACSSEVACGMLRIIIASKYLKYDIKYYRAKPLRA